MLQTFLVDIYTTQTNFVSLNILNIWVLLIYN
jgi:hypothetical protein